MSENNDGLKALFGMLAIVCMITGMTFGVVIGKVFTHPSEPEEPCIESSRIFDEEGIACLPNQKVELLPVGRPTLFREPEPGWIVTCRCIE